MEYISLQEVKPLKKNRGFKGEKLQISEELTLTTYLTSTYSLFSEKVAFDFREGERFISGNTCP